MSYLESIAINGWNPRLHPEHVVATERLGWLGRVLGSRSSSVSIDISSFSRAMLTADDESSDLVELLGLPVVRTRTGGVVPVALASRGWHEYDLVEPTEKADLFDGDFVDLTQVLPDLRPADRLVVRSSYDGAPIYFLRSTGGSLGVVGVPVDVGGGPYPVAPTLTRFIEDQILNDIQGRFFEGWRFFVLEQNLIIPKSVAPTKEMQLLKTGPLHINGGSYNYVARAQNEIDTSLVEIEARSLGTISFSDRPLPPTTPAIRLEKRGDRQLLRVTVGTSFSGALTLVDLSVPDLRPSKEIRRGPGPRFVEVDTTGSFLAEVGSETSHLLMRVYGSATPTS